MKSSLDQLAVIIPVAPGDSAWKTLLPQLESLPPSAEILLVSPESLELPPRFRWIHSPPGRARQLNQGAQASRGKFLWFLHADSKFVSNTLPALERALKKDPEALHYFRLKFLKDGPPLMKINEAGCYLRSRCLGVPFGDQGFCLSRKNFLKIGGFPEGLPYGEDHLFVWRARQKGIRLRPTGAVLRTSARRYAEQGWGAVTFAFAHRWIRQAFPEWVRWILSLPLKKGGKEGFYNRQIPLNPPFSKGEVLLLFAKYPEPGKVKTRLAKSLGEKAACDLYRQMAEKVERTTRPLSNEYHRILFFDPPEKKAAFQNWLTEILDQRPQAGDNLGERLQNAFQEICKEFERVVVIGTDCPELGRLEILKAFNELESKDLVIGPTHDGGYYLLGMRRFIPQIFERIPWSSDRVLEATLKQAKRLKLRVGFLPILSDVDDAEDYQRMAR